MQICESQDQGDIFELWHTNYVAVLEPDGATKEDGAREGRQSPEHSNMLVLSRSLVSKENIEHPMYV